MRLIAGRIHKWEDALPRVVLQAERGQVAKRRWRGVAEDGEEFGFDLAVPLTDGEVFFATESAVYVLQQKPELVLEIPIGADAGGAALLGWRLGNLHFQMEVAEECLVTPDDPAIRQMLEREHIHFTSGERIFKPLSGGHGHAH